MKGKRGRGIIGRRVFFAGAQWTVEQVFRNGKLRLQCGAYRRSVLRDDVAFVRGDYTA